MSIADYLLLALAVAGLWRIHYERAREDEDAAAERGKRNLGRNID